MEKLIRDYIICNKLNMPKVVDDYYNYISTIVRNSNLLKTEDQEEIISDVFLVLWKNQNILDKNAKFSPYISGVTKKIVYKKYKELKIYNLLDEFDENLVDNINIEEIIENKSVNEFIINQLNQIGKLETQIFIKFYYEDKSVKQISKELELSVSNVKTKLHRTRKKLKKIIKVGGIL